MAKQWKPQQITYMKRHASKRRLAELAERFKTDEAQVEAKLTELGLAAKDMVVAPNLAEDPGVKLFERAVKATYRKKWAEAAKMLEEVAATTDLPSLAAQARSFLAVCRERLPARKEEIDPFLEAVYLRNEGQLDEALEFCMRGGRASKDGRFAYLAAAILALQEDHDRAGEFLAKAIEADARHRVAATRDEDFETLRQDPEYSSLFAAN